MRRAFALSFVCLASTAFAAAADLPQPTGESIVSPDAKLEWLFTRTAKIAGGLTEGPAVGPDGSIYFSDIPMGPDKGMILRFDPKTKKTDVFAADSHKSNGLTFDLDGSLLACEGADGGGRGLGRWNVKTKERKVVADKYKGKKFNAPNDIALDSQGRIYFSDPKYVGAEQRELEFRSVYRVDRDGTVTEVTHEVVKPNGVALSPDEKTLYVAEHDNGTDRIDPTQPAPKKGPMKIYAFPLGSDGLASGPKKTIYDFKDQAGCDGMTVDAKGHIYLTSRGLKRPGVLVIDPVGKEVAFIPTGVPNQPEGDPAKPVTGLPSNVEFGLGDEINVLYVTIDTSLYRIPLKARGHHVQYRK
jgi:gluconolactonase